MSDPTSYQRITLKFFTPFAKKDNLQEWQCKFALSGVDLTSSADAEEVALALAAPILSLTTPNTYLGGWLYYPINADVNLYQGTYESTDHPGTEDAYTVPADGYRQQLEVCALAHAVVGVSSKGRAVYLQKHIHDVLAYDDGTGNILPNTADFTTWTTGLGSHDLVTVSPTTGEASEAWSVHTALYTRQLRRGEKAPS
jgi:hypothetical protein